MFQKLKSYNIAIKWRRCADGSKQRNWMSKEDTSSPTMPTEDLMIVSIIDAMEIWDLENNYITGASIKNDYDKEDIHIKVEG